MSTQIETAKVREYGSTVYHLSQQGYQKTSQHCVQGTMNAEGKFFDRIGTVDMYEITDRHGDTQYVETPHSRRYVTPQQFAVADLVDDADQLQTLIDPSNAYTQAQAKSMARKKDDVFRLAALGSAKAGKTGSDTPVALSAGQIDATGTTFAFASVLAARTNFANNDVDLTMEAPHWAMVPKGLEDLLAEVTAVGTGGPNHADHFTARSLQTGEITQAWGFNWHILAPNRHSAGAGGSGTDVRTFAWCPSGMAFAFNEEMFTKITEMPEKNYSTQVYCRWMGGSVRLEEEKVYAVDVDL